MADLAEDWPFPGDPSQYVGSRHHTVPRFYLEYWADNDENIVVVEKADGRRYVTSPKTASAETDFYTYIDLEGNPAGHLEQALGHVEGRAAKAISGITHPLFGRFPPPPDDRADIATMIAFQKIRGKRRRKEIELQADFITKAQYSGFSRSDIECLLMERDGHVNPVVLTELEEFLANLDNYEYVPDPNDHLRMLGSLAFEIFKRLMRRYWYLAVFDAPVLITCDEPVMVYKRNPKPFRGYGVADADEIWFPLNPCMLLTFALQPQPISDRFNAPAQSAEIVNAYAVHNAYQYVFLHPEHQAAMPPLPEDGPLLNVHAPPGILLPDGYNKALKSRKTARRRKSR
jgi:hypothetical protein